MGFKTILVHVDTGRSAPARLKLSADLAARFDGACHGPLCPPAVPGAGLHRCRSGDGQPLPDLRERREGRRGPRHGGFQGFDRRHQSFKRVARDRWAGRGGRGGSRPLRRSGDRRAVGTGCRGNDNATGPRRDGRHRERTAGAHRAPYRRDQAAGKDGDAVLERHPRSGAGGDRRAADPQEGRQGDHPAVDPRNDGDRTAGCQRRQMACPARREGGRSARYRRRVQMSAA